MAKIFLKKQGSDRSQGPFDVLQLKKLIQLNKISPNDFFSKDSQQWHSASKLPSLIAQFEKIQATSHPAETSNKNSAIRKKSLTESLNSQNIEKKRLNPRSHEFRPKTSGKSGSSITSRRKPSGFWKTFRIVVLLLILLAVGGGVYVRNLAVTSGLPRAKLAIDAFCKSIGITPTYSSLELSPFCNYVILKNVVILNEENFIDLTAQELRLHIGTVKTMGWFLSNDINIEQPQTLNVYINTFSGQFFENSPTYRFGSMNLTFYGSFTKQDQVIDGAVSRGTTLIKLDPSTTEAFEKAERELSMSLPREGEALKMEISGPFKKIIITTQPEEWDQVCDKAFR